MPIRRSTRYFFSSVALLAATSGIFYSGLPARARGQAATNSAWTIFAPANDVSFTISKPRPKYSVHNQISLNYPIANIGNRPLVSRKPGSLLASRRCTCRHGLRIVKGDISLAVTACPVQSAIQPFTLPSSSA